MDQKAKNKWQKEYRKKTKNLCTKKYEKTPNGFLMRLYRNMQSRVKGIQKIKFHLYKGCELLPREQFYTWAKESKDFHKLFKTWVKNNYSQKLTPTVNRIDPNKGYTLNNMEWLTHSENSRLGAISTKRKMKI